MRLSLIRQLFATFAVIVFMAASWGAASQMGPDQNEVRQQQTALLLGLSISDFCGDSDADHDHTCPFCDKTSDPPLVRISVVEQWVIMGGDDPVPHDLVTGPQHIHAHIATRAPPHII